MTNKSTPNRERFIIEYCVDRNGTKAATRAGYSEKTAAAQASRLLRNVNIKAAIEKRLAEVVKAVGVDAVWAINRRVEIVDRCMRAEPVYDKEGNETGEYVFDSSGANKALDAIEKMHLGMAKKIDVDVDIDVGLKDDAITAVRKALGSIASAKSSGSSIEGEVAGDGETESDNAAG